MLLFVFKRKEASVLIYKIFTIIRKRELIELTRIDIPLCWNNRDFHM